MSGLGATPLGGGGLLPMQPIARPDDAAMPAPLPGVNDTAARPDFATVMLALFGPGSAERAAPDAVRDAARSPEEAEVLLQQEEAAAEEAAVAEAMQALLADTLRALPPEVLPAPRALPDVPPPPAPRETAMRTLEGIAPALRERLERVIDRMQREFGHTVEVMETVRSPERQAWLFAQGRSRPGPVVTWTRDSAHLTGDAVDVRIDGQWRNDRAYGRLQRIAEEEGLRTLGARDPGHLELPATLRAARRATDATTVAAAPARGRDAESRTLPEQAARQAPDATPRPARDVGGPPARDITGLPERAADVALARAAANAARQAAQAARAARDGTDATTPPGLSVALAASVNGHAHGLRAKAAAAGLELPPATDRTPRGKGHDADAAAPGGVAPVATVAEVASVARVAGVANVATPAAVAGPGVPGRAVRRDDDHTVAAAAPRGRARHRHEHETGREGPTTSASTPFPTIAMPTGAEGDTPAPRMAQAIDRVTSVNAIAARSPRAVAQLTLAVDAGDGRRDEVTVGVRGGQVDAAVITGDRATADRLAAGVRDLREALDTRGLVLDEWRAEVRRAPEAESLRASTPEREAIRLAAGADAGAFGREQPGDRPRAQDERAPGREPRDESARDQRAHHQEQRERQAAARDHATRAAAWRRVGRPFLGDDAA